MKAKTGVIAILRLFARHIMQLLLVAMGLLWLAAGSRADTNLTWTDADVSQMWSGYTNDFYVVAASGHHIFGVTAGSSTITGFWEEAEEIEMAEDAYNWASGSNNIFGNAGSIAAMVDDLCAGFVAHNGSLWSADQYDDDLDWATIAFARAYQITGNSQWLADATNNFNTCGRTGSSAA